jgi:hypothetical protein
MAVETNLTELTAGIVACFVRGALPGFQAEMTAGR